MAGNNNIVLRLPIVVPNTLNIKNFVTTELTFDTFLTWQKIFAQHLRTQKMLGVVDGSIKCPPLTHPQHSIWLDCNELIQSWIIATLSPPVLETFLNYDCDSALTSWETLEQLYLQHAASTKMHLRSKFQNFKKNALSMNDYLQKIHSIFSALKAVGEPYTDDDLVAQTLLGLSREYNPFITVMNAQRPYPEFKDLRPLLLSEEDRALIEIPPPITHTDSHQLLYSSSSYGNNKDQFKGKNKVYPPRSGKTCHSFKTRSTSEGILGEQPEANSKKNIKCQICGKFNHEAFQCIKRFDHAFTAPQMHNSLAAMQINENSSTTWFPDSGATSHMTGSEDQENLSDIQ